MKDQGDKDEEGATKEYAFPRKSTSKHQSEKVDKLSEIVKSRKSSSQGTNK